MQKELTIRGMACRHCVTRVAKIIEKAQGVANVQVSLEKQEASFACDPAVTDVAGIVQAINDFGFTAAEKG